MPTPDPGALLATWPQLADRDSPLFTAMAGIGGASGPECFRMLAQSLATVLGVAHAVVAEFVPATSSARSLAFWSRGAFVEDVEWTVAGTPCQRVLEGATLVHHPCDLQQRFPADEALVALGAQSYLGVPLVAPDGGVLGHLFVIDTAPMATSEPPALALVHVFAARAASELHRLRLERALAASEDRLRDLFDEAPIAYVHEGTDTRFIRANKAARRILGIGDGPVEGIYGREFVPDTPEAQARLREAFASVHRGTDTSGVVLELRRRDDGRPIFIQWWSRPDVGGEYTRTMFVDITEHVLMTREHEQLRAQNLELREQLRTHDGGEIVGRSPGLLRVLERVDRVAPTDSTVLIQGETGVGKELIARAIHERSRRSHAPFVKVNCAALPAGLVESEFFGHEKGAFTGAVQTRRGRFELADGGTIFLDEIGEVAPDVQVKLLRVLQENQFERVGGTQTIRVNVRVIAATNRDLGAEVEAGRFRADLYYRLDVLPIAVPPLRERTSDIPILASYMVTQIAMNLGRRIDAIEPATLERLVRYRWPGNVRELRNVLERAVILCDGPVLRVDASELRLGADVGEARTDASLADVERAHILAVLERTGGAIAGPAGAAKILGLPPSTLRSRMEKLGIKG